MNEQYCLSKVYCKIYHPNLFLNNEYINQYQNNHRDFTVGLPNSVLKKKILRNHQKSYRL